VFYLVGLFDLWDGVRTLAISSIGTYAIASFFKTSPLMPWIGFAFVMGHMSINHIARQAANTPSVVDITGAQMVLVMKLSAFCWNVADGQLPPDQLSDFQKDRVLPHLPGLLDYAGYVFFFPSLFAGPAFDFAEYRRWLDTTMFDVPAQVDASKRPPVRKKRRIPRSGTPSTWKALLGLSWLGMFVYLGPKYDAAYLATASFAAHGFLKRVMVLYLVGLTARLKYYAVWTLAEGACILAGLGFNGVDPTTGRVSWNRLQNINPWGVETAQNPRAYLAGWNMNTNNWLRNYVYLRVTPRGKKPGFRASLLTFGTSALWHGFYPGYYLTFVLASLVQTVAKSTWSYDKGPRRSQSSDSKRLTGEKQTSDATCDPSSSIPSRAPHHPPKSTTICSASCQPSSSSPLSSPPSWSSPSPAHCTCGPASTFTAWWQPSFLWPHLPRPPSSCYGRSSKPRPAARERWCGLRARTASWGGSPFWVFPRTPNASFPRLSRRSRPKPSSRGCNNAEYGLRKADI
jgi:hypothetical protein